MKKRYCTRVNIKWFSLYKKRRKKPGLMQHSDTSKNTKTTLKCLMYIMTTLKCVYVHQDYIKFSKFKGMVDSCETTGEYHVCEELPWVPRLLCESVHLRRTNEVWNKTTEHADKITTKIKPVLEHAWTQGPGSILGPCFALEVCWKQVAWVVSLAAWVASLAA